MAKGYQAAFPKGRDYKPEVIVRELPPKIQKAGDAITISCPFCPVPHPINIGQNSPCGTKMVVKAVQTVYPTRTVNKYKLICLKCGESGGEMIRFNNGYVHLADCKPSVRLLATAPKFSRAAALVWRSPKWLSAMIEKYTGKVQEVQEIDAEGNETGKILGYFFLREVNNGRPRTDPETNPG